MTYTAKQRKVKEYLLDNIDMQGYIEALDNYVKEKNAKTKGFYSRVFSGEQGFLLENFITLGSKLELFKNAIAYAGYKQPEADRTWLSVISVYRDLLKSY